MRDLRTVRDLQIEWCPNVCAKAKPHVDPLFGNTQYNCPYHFGVNYQAAIINGKVMCKRLKRKEVDG